MANCSSRLIEVRKRFPYRPETFSGAKVNASRIDAALARFHAWLSTGQSSRGGLEFCRAAAKTREFNSCGASASVQIGAVNFSTWSFGNKRRNCGMKSDGLSGEPSVDVSENVTV